MTVETVKSTLVTAVTTPGTNANMLLPQQRSEEHVMYDGITVATTSLDDVGDIILVAALPSNAILLSLPLYNGAMDTDATPLLAFKVGLFYLIGNGTTHTTLTEMTTANAIVSTAQTTLRASNHAGVELAFIDRSLVADMGKRLWELGGLTSDCGGMLALGFKISAVAATAASADLFVKPKYVLG